MIRGLWEEEYPIGQETGCRASDSASQRGVKRDLPECYKNYKMLDILSKTRENNEIMSNDCFEFSLQNILDYAKLYVSLKRGATS